MASLWIRPSNIYKNLFSRDTLKPTSPWNSTNNLFSKVLFPEPDGPANTSGRPFAMNNIHITLLQEHLKTNNTIYS